MNADIMIASTNCHILGINSPMLSVIIVIVGETIAAVLVAVIIHEEGHALATLACGLRLSSFVIGIGPTVLKLRVGRTDFILKLVPITGHIWREPTKRRWARIVIDAAGPLANGLALAPIAALYRLWPGHEEVLLVFGFYQALFLIATLLPTSRKIDGVRIPSDGMRIYDLLFRYHPPSSK
ncbi:site-2 protease family protein [Rhizobium sp. WW_1]|jgi:hypothetical protein|uniref:site-2 protease family protein n=1 Tax=Rhizobium sp. WW_1 TaxID=1907375 RepID=UPI000FF10297|nr:site-2 protease family protein [Rhizobium sp. WW_1]RKD67755.1 peptidase M50-like protein [Rhizobium sp. WW_1]